MIISRFALFVLAFAVAIPYLHGAEPASPGVVSHIKVLSDKVPDVSNLDAWRKSFLRDGMTDQEKALAVWRTTVMFQHQDAPPREELTHEHVVQDPFKIFNVYGYSFCSVASCDIECLSRSAGLRARGWGIKAHSVPEVYWDGAWHMLDASLINYFPKSDGSIAGVEEIIAAIQQWHGKNAGYRGDDQKLRAYQRENNKTGWTRGPDLLARCPFYTASGWWPAGTHGWYSTMQEYDCSADGSRTGKAFLYEYGYSQGYQVNVQLRPGERLTRNWSNRGLHVNMKDGKGPGCMKMTTGSHSLVYTPSYGDIAPGRVGNGTLTYDMPVKSAAYRAGAFAAENLAPEAVRVQDAAKPGVLVVRMPSSYVYLTGALSFTAAVGSGGAITVSFSDNNGLDWKELTRVTASGEQTVDLSPLVLRRYDYRLKFALQGAGTGLDALKIVHDIQHSQRPLPALDRGDNTITFSAGPAEGTVTVEGATNLAQKGKQLTYADFHPEMSGFEKSRLVLNSANEGALTFPVATPGDMVRIRFGAHYAAYHAQDGLDYQVSFDGGKTWKTVGRAAGPTRGHCEYVVCADVPAGTRQALVRYAAQRRDTTAILNFRIDADYREPFGGFRPVRVAYQWEEDGQPKQDVHVALQPQETYTIRCAAKPVMKAITLELAE
jgi:hypothetical protein